MKLTFKPDAHKKILVIGDLILDRYLHGETTRISPEAPVPVVLIRHTEERPGGAANVALNIASLGMNVTLLGLTGDDPASDTLVNSLSGHGVECVFVRQPGFPTITKLRVLSQHQQLIRLDYEARSDLAEADRLQPDFNRLVRLADVVVLSDYAKGSLARVSEYISTCRTLGKKVLVDPKGSDFNRYHGANLLTPNLKEFESIVGRCKDEHELVEKGRNLCKQLGLESLLVTRGEQGMTLIQREQDTVHLHAEAREVFDVTGAGDTVIASLAAALTAGYGYVQAAQLANRAAGLVVAKLGAASVTVEELNAVHTGTHLDSPPVLTETELLKVVHAIRARGETIVMTNGCFDILHAGHVHYLEQARALGDYLIVAVNDDDSVQRLKGSGRPVNPLQQRMAVLAALKSVDYVVPFSEDTPERLINAVLPDILVKGGDYMPEQIAGAKAVTRNGGSVRIIPLLGNCSTTRILETANTRKGKKK